MCFLRIRKPLRMSMLNWKIISNRLSLGFLDQPQPRYVSSLRVFGVRVFFIPQVLNQRKNQLAKNKPAWRQVPAHNGELSGTHLCRWAIRWKNSILTFPAVAGCYLQSRETAVFYWQEAALGVIAPPYARHCPSVCCLINESMNTAQIAQGVSK